MAWLERQRGCNASPDPEHCMGPWEDYVTLFGTELPFLLPHLAVALLLGAALAGWLIVGRRRLKNSIRPGVATALGAATSAVAFLLLAYLFPVEIQY